MRTEPAITMLSLAALDQPVEPSEVNSLLVSNNPTAKIADRTVDAIWKEIPRCAAPLRHAPPSLPAVPCAQSSHNGRSEAPTASPTPATRRAKNLPAGPISPSWLLSANVDVSPAEEEATVAADPFPASHGDQFPMSLDSTPMHPISPAWYPRIPRKR